MALKLITAPIAEPLTLAEAKAHLRVDESDDDALIEALIVAARQGAEHITQRALMPQTWELALDQFESEIRLPKAPLASVIGVKYVESSFPYTITAQGAVAPNDADGSDGDCYWRTDTDDIFVKSVGTWGSAVRKLRITLADTEYQLDLHSEPARLAPAYATRWPAVRCQPNAVLVRYTAGYVDAAAVPQEIKSWMLLRIGMLYENRESVVAGVSVTELPYVDCLLDAYRVWGL
jgi:hypothetical protein